MNLPISFTSCLSPLFWVYPRAWPSHPVADEAGGGQLPHVSLSMEPPPHKLGQGHLGPQYPWWYHSQCRQRVHPSMGAEWEKGAPLFNCTCLGRSLSNRYLEPGWEMLMPYLSQKNCFLSGLAEEGTLYFWLYLSGVEFPSWGREGAGLGSHT